MIFKDKIYRTFVLCNMVACMLVFKNDSVHAISSDLENKAQALMQQGNAFYQKGDYVQAQKAYLEVDDLDVRSFELLYNLGNTYFKQREYGKAILWYERCLKYGHTSEDVLHNLVLSRKNILDKEEAQNSINFSNTLHVITNLLDEKQWAFISIFCFILLSASLFYLFLQQVPDYRKIFFTLSLIFGFFFLLSLGFGIAKKNQLEAQQEAIVLAPSVSVYSEPSNQSKQIFVIHEGSKVTLIGKQDGWINFSISNGNEGWCLETQVAFI